MAKTSFPGSDLVSQGVEDLSEGRDSIPALLVLIGAPRLRALGISVPRADIAAPEHRLYHKLWEEDPDSAHSRYNALVRRLVSFERAMECAS
ncbi:MAG: hypothetical protein ACRD1X_18790 [Vicinamibacteria bacterium]